MPTETKIYDKELSKNLVKDKPTTQKFQKAVAVLCALCIVF